MVKKATWPMTNKQSQKNFKENKEKLTTNVKKARKSNLWVATSVKTSNIKKWSVGSKGSVKPRKSEMIKKILQGKIKVKY